MFETVEQITHLRWTTANEQGISRCAPSHPFDTSHILLLNIITLSIIMYLLLNTVILNIVIFLPLDITILNIIILHLIFRNIIITSSSHLIFRNSIILFIILLKIIILNIIIFSSFSTSSSSNSSSATSSPSTSSSATSSHAGTQTMWRINLLHVMPNKQACQTKHSSVQTMATSVHTRTKNTTQKRPRRMSSHHALQLPRWHLPQGNGSQTWCKKKYKTGHWSHQSTTQRDPRHKNSHYRTTMTFFPRASKRRVLLIGESVKHCHIFSSSHLHILTSCLPLLLALLLSYPLLFPHLPGEGC